jgi:hypothetical protein
MTDMYSTADFYTAALLICLRYEIVEVTREGVESRRDGKGRTRRFHFYDSKELRQDLMDYMNNKKVGNLRDYRDAIETVKELVHS